MFTFIKSNWTDISSAGKNCSKKIIYTLEKNSNCLKVYEWNARSDRDRVFLFLSGDKHAITEVNDPNHS